MTESARTVGLFVTCLVDVFRPTVAEASVHLIEQAGFRVVVPAQTCCGQANFNGGDADGARRLARRVIAAFGQCAYVVVPSASCAATIRGYPELLAGAPQEHDAAVALAARTRELTVFLSEAGATAPAGVRWTATAAYHDSCSALRQLGIRREPRELLAGVAGLALREITGAEECCGFGGTFCARYPQVSAQIGDEKITDIVATGAGHLIGADLGCLLHLEGRMQRRGIAVRAVHVAEALAGMVPGADGGNG
jgi:L-lactate dehydrogenase complex protein LldE